MWTDDDDDDDDDEDDDDDAAAADDDDDKDEKYKDFVDETYNDDSLSSDTRRTGTAASRS